MLQINILRIAVKLLFRFQRDSWKSKCWAKYSIMDTLWFDFQHRSLRFLPIICVASMLRGVSPIGKLISNIVLQSKDFVPSSVGRELSNCRTDPRVLSAGRDSAPLAHLAIVMLTLYPLPPSNKPAYSQLSYHRTLL